jgi:PPOX class probable F420-dependent enzyme
MNGVPVDTPIWVVQVGDRLGAFTDDRSFKFKRVRRNPEVEVAGCDVWGRCSTAWYPAHCRIVTEPDQRQRIFDAIAQKYGIHWKLSTWGSQLVGRIKHRVVFEFEVTPTPLGTTFQPG